MYLFCIFFVNTLLFSPPSLINGTVCVRSRVGTNKLQPATNPISLIVASKLFLFKRSILVTGERIYVNSIQWLEMITRLSTTNRSSYYNSDPPNNKVMNFHDTLLHQAHEYRRTEQKLCMFAFFRKINRFPHKQTRNNLYMQNSFIV